MVVFSKNSFYIYKYCKNMSSEKIFIFEIFLYVKNNLSIFHIYLYINFTF